LEFIEHCFDIAEGAIDASEADVGDFIHEFETFHNEFPNDITGDFLFAEAIEFLFDLLSGIFDFASGKRAFFASFAEAEIELLAVERFAALVAFDNHEVELFDALIGAKAALALFAFTAAMDSIADIARIFDA